MLRIHEKIINVWIYL
uniref:Uncharacterized protein n=1 Tax=Lepeophtheirus salmonis TaxID=72036 RepID=A0A0K2UG96_LEPSM